MLVGYADESGSIMDRDVMVVAILLSTAKKWVKFEQTWGRLLRRYGFEKDEPFHMKDFEARRGRYADWTNTKRTQFASQIAGIIKSNILFAASTGILVKDWNTWMRGRTKGKFLRQSPYVVLLATVLGYIDSQQLLPTDEPFSLICDRNIDAAPAAKRFIEEPANQLRDVCDSVKFADKSNFRPLQAADIVAYECYKHWHNTKIESTPRPIRKLFENLISAEQIHSFLLTEEMLSFFRRGLDRAHGFTTSP